MKDNCSIVYAFCVGCKFCDMMMRSVTGKTSACMLIATRKSIVMEAHVQVSVDIYTESLLHNIVKNV